MVKVLYGVPTSELQTGDIVVRNDEAQSFEMAEEIADSDYLRITWTGTDADSVTVRTTTAQPWDEWPLVIRQA